MLLSLLLFGKVCVWSVLQFCKLDEIVTTQLQLTDKS